MKMAPLLLGVASGLLAACCGFFSPISIFMGMILGALVWLSYARYLAKKEKERFILERVEPRSQGQDQGDCDESEASTSAAHQQRALEEHTAHEQSSFQWRLPFSRVGFQEYVGTVFGITTPHNAGTVAIPAISKTDKEKKSFVQPAMAASGSSLRKCQQFLTDIPQNVRAAWTFHTDTTQDFCAIVLGKERIIRWAGKGVPIIRLLPYVEWEKYRELLSVVTGNRIEEVKLLLAALSQDQKRLQQYLFYRNAWDERDALQTATAHAAYGCYKDRPQATEILLLLLEAIAPEERMALLNQREYGFFLAHEAGAVTFRLVMERLSENERWTLLDYAHPLWGDTPLMTVRSKEAVEAVLDYCPGEKLFDYVSRKNFFGRTALIEWVESRGGVGYEAAEFIERLVQRLPEEERPAFFASHEQGRKAMWLAQADGKRKVVELLVKYGIPKAIPYEELIQAVAAHCRTISPANQQSLIEQLDEARGHSLSRPLDLGKVKDVESVLAVLVCIRAKKQERMFAALATYGVPLPRTVPRLDMFIETLERWAVTEQLEREGVVASEDTPVDILWERLEALLENPIREDSKKRLEEEKQKAIEGFQSQVGQHPAALLGVAKSQWHDPEARQRGYYQEMREWHPDRAREEEEARKKVRLITAAYGIYKERSRRIPYLKGADLERAEVNNDFRKQLRIDYEKTFAEERFKERFDLHLFI